MLLKLGENELIESRSPSDMSRLPLFVRRRVFPSAREEGSLLPPPPCVSQVPLGDPQDRKVTLVPFGSPCPPEIQKPQPLEKTTYIFNIFFNIFFGTWFLGHNLSRPIFLGNNLTF